MKYVCQICGYVYDDAKEKVPFAELPDDWKCPLCGAAKSDFKPEVNGDEKKVVTDIEPMEADLEKPVSYTHLDVYKRQELLY